MPRLTYTRGDNYHYIMLPSKLVMALGWKAGDSIRFTYEHPAEVVLEKDDMHFVSNRKLAFIKGSSAFRLVVPVSLVDFFQWDAGKWLQISSCYKQIGIRLSPSTRDYNRAEDRQDLKNVTAMAEIDNRIRQSRETISNSKTHLNS